MSSEMMQRTDDVVAQLSHITAAEMQSLGEVAASAPPPEELWPPNERFWFNGTAGVNLQDADNRAVRMLWTRVMQVLATNIAGRDAISSPRPLLDWLDRRIETRGRMRVEGDATAILERALGGQVWRAVVVVWNACCAALLAQQLPAELRSSLEAGWRRAGIGEPPLDRMRRASAD